jgi:diacylglycerol kinase family enzyme
LKVSLLHNESAGYSVKLDEIRNAIERKGHEILTVIEKHEDRDELLDPASELIVVAGGDGTIASAVRVMAPQPERLPLAILPIGTANNIATSLGIVGSLTELVGRWESARRVPLDAGLVSGSWGRKYFIEGVGCGLVPAGIQTVQASRADRHGDPPDKVERAQALFRETLEGLRPQPLSVAFDSTTLTGEFLLLEVLNVRSVGPNLVLSPDASPSDGYLTVVMASESDREELDDYLRRLPEAADARLHLPVHKARSVEIEGVETLHVDDRVTSLTGHTTLRAEVARGVLEVLV